jgi:sugar (pentulose or hexulose) kinase
LYNDGRGIVVIEQVQAIAPTGHTVLSSTSSLTKLFWWTQQFGDTRSLEDKSKPYFLHQVDWLGFLLHGQLGISDYHNALKLGYDVGALRYPDWLDWEALPFQVPVVKTPGEPIAPVTAAIASQFGFPTDCWVCAGTTDSIAAFLASGVQAPGEAVTSLGSTLVLKLLSTTRVDNSDYGIYSHRLGNLWLVGGASNTGGAVLQQFFTDNALRSLSEQIRERRLGDRPQPFVYYPLTQPGERFPTNDPNLPPCMEPRPDDPAEFLYYLLDGMARIERRGYQLLQDFGATPLKWVYTAGGGAKNEVWTELRSRHLGVAVKRSPQTEAAYGTALLAMKRQEGE